MLALLGLVGLGVEQLTGHPGRTLRATSGVSRPHQPSVVPTSRARGTNDWRLRRPAEDGQVEAWSAPASGVPGTAVALMVSTTAGSYRVTAYRIGADAGGWGVRVWQSAVLPGTRQPDPVLRPRRTRTVEAPWRRSLTVDTTGWAPGFYVLKVHAASGWETLVPYVASSASAAGTVALVAPVATWEAYNTWGGYSLYQGPSGDRNSWAVSLDRPYHLAPGANDFRTAALPLVVRAERLGIRLSYFTDLDLQQRPGALAGARGYASLGHDEYWTNQMRSAVEAARDAGTNLAFFSANTMYWRVRLRSTPVGTGRLVVGYRGNAALDPAGARDPGEVTGRFRDPPGARPENELVGTEYECFPVDADYRVAAPGWWGFEGTGVARGDSFPDLVGPEADRVYPDSRTPRPLQVLSDTPYDCAGSPTSSQSVYYTAPSGAGVFATGTLRWSCALADGCDVPLSGRTRRFVGTVTDNVLRAWAAGPAGRDHPAWDNLDRFGLSMSNGVPTS